MDRTCADLRDAAVSEKKRKSGELEAMIRKKNEQNTKRMRLSNEENAQTDDTTEEREFNRTIVETLNKIDHERKKEEKEEMKRLTKFQRDEKKYFNTMGSEARPAELAPYPDLAQAVLKKTIPSENNPFKLSAWDLMSDEVKHIRENWKKRIANSKHRGVTKAGSRTMKTKMVAVERERDELSIRLQRSENLSVRVREDLRRVEMENISLRMEVERLSAQWKERQDTIMSFDSYIPRPDTPENWEQSNLGANHLENMFLTIESASKNLMI
mgnify:CR=1 FL=1